MFFHFLISNVQISKKKNYLRLSRLKKQIKCDKLTVTPFSKSIKLSYISLSKSSSVIPILFKWLKNSVFIGENELSPKSSSTGGSSLLMLISVGNKETEKLK